jgi:hypothetical protein
MRSKCGEVCIFLVERQYIENRDTYHFCYVWLMPRSEKHVADGKNR